MIAINQGLAQKLIFSMPELHRLLRRVNTVNTDSLEKFHLFKNFKSLYNLKENPNPNDWLLIQPINNRNIKHEHALISSIHREETDLL